MTDGAQLAATAVDAHALADEVDRRSGVVTREARLDELAGTLARFDATWGVGRTVDLASLTVNYRTPREVMAEAEPVIRAAIPDANVPTSIRESGVPVVHGTVTDLDAVVTGWLVEHAEGTACVIGDPGRSAAPRVQLLSPELAKGLEFDLVVLVDPEDFGEGIEGAVDRYVAMTRATQQLVVLTSP